MARAEQLKKYAQLIAEKGVNVRTGQDVVIRAELDQPVFVRMLTEACYRLGANRVIVDWEYAPLKLLHNSHCSLETLSEVLNFEETREQYYVDRLPCMIYLCSEDPEALTGLDQEKNSKAAQARHRIFKPYLDAQENKIQWCIAAVPGRKWAKKVFPGCTAAAAEKLLWERILLASRVTDNPLLEWDRHNAEIHRRCDVLNGMGIRELHYYGDNGTDLTVGLIPNSRFAGGSEKTLSGAEFNPNIPSEEIFISPMRGKAEGIVKATKPLSARGEIIDGFSITFRDGRAVDCQAETNEKLLRELIEMDEGSHYLGECAFIPQQSPIAQTGILFYNTLFDENASCHLALGQGFAETIQDYDRYTLEQCREMGINDSILHLDFMIGYSGLNIDALTEQGQEIPLFRNGEWAFS